MKLGTKLGITGCAVGFAIATYFIVNPVVASLASESQINSSAIGALLGFGFCVAGTLFGLFSARKQQRNA